MIEIEGTYIQYEDGYDKDEITESDLTKSLQDLPERDDEHGGFWIGVYGVDPCCRAIKSLVQSVYFL